MYWEPKGIYYDIAVQFIPGGEKPPSRDKQYYIYIRVSDTSIYIYGDKDTLFIYTHGIDWENRKLLYIEVAAKA